MTFTKDGRAATRPYTKNLDIQHVFEHVRKVTKVACVVADNTGKNACVDALIYRTMRGSDPKVHSAIMQAAIRDVVAARKIYGTKVARGMKSA